MILGRVWRTGLLDLMNIRAGDLPLDLPLYGFYARQDARYIEEKIRPKN